MASQSGSDGGSADWSDGNQTSDEEIRAAEVFISDDEASELSEFSEAAGSSKKAGECSHDARHAQHCTSSACWTSDVVRERPACCLCSACATHLPVQHKQSCLLRCGPLHAPIAYNARISGLPTQKSAIEDKSAATRDQGARKAQTQTKASSAIKRTSAQKSSGMANGTSEACAAKSGAPQALAPDCTASAPAQEGSSSQATDAARIREANIQAMLADEVQLERQPVLPRYLNVRCS